MDKLTADAVVQKRFTAVRLREGYSMDEVDTFLDEVESALREHEENPSGAGGENLAGRLQKELQEARHKVDALTKERDQMERERNEAVDTLRARGGQLPQMPPVPLDVAQAPEPADGMAAATRMLEIAAKNHDELIAQGKAEAERLISEAQMHIQQQQREIEERDDSWNRVSKTYRSQ